MKIETIEIHGHDVIDMMEAAQIDYTRDSLKDAILEKFGAAARFHTCSANGLDAYGIIDLLVAKGKFSGNEAGFRFDPATRCNH